MKMMKKGLALALAVLMLTTAIPFGGLAVLAEEMSEDISSYLALQEGVSAMAVITESLDRQDFSFTPAEDGYYVFYSFAPEGVDTRGCIHFEEHTEEDDDGGEHNNFRVVAFLNAGVTYHLQAYFWGEDTGSYPVLIERTMPKVIEAVDFHDVIYLSTDRNEEGLFDAFPRMTITYSDGTSEERESDWIHDDTADYYVEVTYDVPTEQWVEGGTYTATANIPELKMSGVYTVSIQALPVASVYVPPITYIQNYHGWETNDWHWDDELGGEVPTPTYRRYSVWPDGMVVTLRDGTVIEGTEFEWNGQNFWTSTNDTQNYNNQWGVGVHTVTGAIAGYEFTYTVEVMESPVASVVVTNPVTLFEHSNGHWENGSYWDDELQQYVEYTFYNYKRIWPRATVTMRDGTVFENVTDIEWNGERWGFSVDSQDWDRYLTKGTNTWHGNLLGCSFTYEINVIDTLVESVTVAPMQLIENYNGYWDYDYEYDEFGNETKLEYYYYHNVYPRDIVITLKDGTVIHEDGFYWNDEWFDLTTSGQNYKNRLQVGTNEMSASVAGYDFTYTVEVLESPVASVVANPVTLVAHQNGSWNTSYIYDEEQDREIEVEWFRYHNIVPSITVTLKDGTVIHGGYFEWGDWSFGMSITNQWYENRLLPGKNMHTGSIAGYEFEYVINIATISSNDTYEYMETEDGMIITYCYEFNETLEIPATIDGKPVIGIADLGWSEDVRHLIIPDSVVTLGEYVLENLQTLESIHFGAGISTITPDMMRWLYELNSITISADNANYCVVDGVLYDKAMTTFIAYPVANGKTDYEVPATVVNIGGLDYRIYRNLNVTFAEGHLAYKSVDGVIYDKDMTEIISVRKDKTGNYVMPETVEKIATGAFDGSQLTGVVVSPKVTEIVYCAFANCASLESVTLPEGLISIEMAAFENTTSLKSIELPSTLQYIGTRAFDYSGLTSLTVPGSVEGIGYAAFRNTKIATLTFHEGIEGIDSYAFANIPLQTLTLPDSLNGVGEYAFSNCRSLTAVDLGNGLQYVGEGAFSSTGIQSLHIPSNVIFVGERAFAYTPIASLTISEGVQEIDTCAFFDCNQLQAVHLPSTLGYLGTNVFGSCNSLTTLTVTEGEYFFGAGNCVITHGGTIVAGCNGSVLPQDGSVQVIGDYAFWDMDGLQNVNLPAGLKSIGDYAFYECDGITSVVTPESLTYLGICAFSDIDNLVRVQLGDNIDFVGSGAFSGTPLTSIDLGNSLSFIAPYALQGTALESVFVPSSVTDIMYFAFDGCEALTSIEIPITVTSIEESAFENCISLTDVYYQGTEADRNEMYISEWGNDYLLDATWHYEWTSDKWADIACEHVYDHACDTSCNLCGEIRQVVGHQYDNTCDGDCNVCGELRPVGEHDYHPQVVRPNDCGHDGLMGYTCAICGNYYEEPIPATGDHEYENACDTSCNMCGEIRQVEGHQYDNTCDGDCNICGEFRPTGEHDFHPQVVIPNTCGADGLMGYTCAICGAYYEEPTLATGNHKYDNACDDCCNVCEAYRPVGDHQYDNACDAFCNICDAERAVGEHEYDNKYDADCNICGDIREVPLQPAFTVLSGNAIIGETVDVWVDVEHTPGITQATIDLHYDGSVLELVGSEGGVFDGVILTPSGASVIISWAGDPAEDNYTDGTMARFTFALKDGVAPGSTAVNVSYKMGSIYSTQGEVVDFLINNRIVNIYENVRGDADGDGEVSTRDLAEMIQNLNGWEVEVVSELLDVDTDGKMTNRDYVLINRYYNGWDVELQ